jgi:hypothetical protein
MPIRPEHRQFYRKEWRKYRLALIAAHGARCSVCKREVTKYLNLAHVAHDPRSSGVALMCAACHNRHDAPFRYAVWRRNRAKRYGQGWLWPEVATAPYATWLRPRPRRAPEAEEGLF